MHDLTLGPEVETGETSSSHSGQCTDGVFGCSKCWNGANDGKGRLSSCDWCKKRGYTRITRAADEPVLYALCKRCGDKNAKYYEEEEYAPF